MRTALAMSFLLFSTFAVADIFRDAQNLFRREGEKAVREAVKPKPSPAPERGSEAPPREEVVDQQEAIRRAEERKEQVAKENAEARAKWQRDEEERYKETDVRICTINGRVSENCVRINRKRRHQEETTTEELQACECLRLAAHSLEAAQRQAIGMVERGYKSAESQECYGYVNEKYGTQWRTEAERVYKLQRDAEEAATRREAFLDKLEDEIRDHFKKKCGTKASLHSRSSLQLVVDSTRGKGIFLSRKHPDGNKLTIKCSGHVVLTNDEGGSMTLPPLSHQEVSEMADESECVDECLASIPYCPKNINFYGHSKVADGCIKDCEIRCGKKRR